MKKAKRLIRYFIVIIAIFSFLFSINFVGAVTAGDILIVGYSGGSGQIEGLTKVVDGQYTYTVPAGVTQIKVQLWGAGGGGGAGGTGSLGSSGNLEGGGGGAYGEVILDVSSSQTYNVAVGAGGNGVGYNLQTPPTSGGNSVFGTYYANGGSAGAVIPNGWNSHPGGTGSGGTFNTPIGTNGGSGGSIGAVNGCGSGGAGGVAPGGNGAQAGPSAGAGGGASGGGAEYAGNGGAGGNCVLAQSGQNIPGGNGFLYGGGGGSSGVTTLAVGNGGKGAEGQVKITYLSVGSQGSQTVQPTSGLCVPNQTIISLYQESNSHGAIYNQTFNDVNAGIGVCYDKIFGFNYTGDTNPQRCGAENANSVVKVISKNNAHVEDKSLNNYPYSLCYGDLNCKLEDKTYTPSANERAVLYLSSNTNAHVSSTAGYDFIVYCTSNNGPVPGTGEIISAEWKDEFENNLAVDENGNNKSNVNSTVKLVAKTTFINTEITFDIKEEDTGLPDANIRTGAIALKATTNGEGIASISWLINDTDMTKAGVGPAEFYFTASVFEESKQSGILLTSKTPTPPEKEIEIEIAGIKDKGLYFTGVPVEISYVLRKPSQGRGLELTWKIIEDNYESDDLTFDYTFQNPGQKTIHLTATNSFGGRAERQVSVLAIGDNGIFAFIDNPRFNEVLPVSSDNVRVLYNASGSYVVNSTYDKTQCLDILARGRLVCLAGRCPNAVGNPPAGCSALVEENNKGYENLNFTWTRYGKSSINTFSRFGLKQDYTIFGNSEYSNKLNDRAFKLVLNYTNESEDLSLQQEFMRNYTIGQCINDGRGFVKIDSKGNVLKVLETTNKNSGDFDPNACRAVSGIVCCPTGHLCGANGCYIPASTPDIVEDLPGCSRYRTELACLDAVETTNACSDGGLTAATSCQWVEQTGGSGECKEYTSIIETSNGAVAGTCVQGVRNLTSCVNGFNKIKIDTTYTGGSNPANSCLSEDDCKNKAGEFTVPCGRPAFELPFFGIEQLLSALLIIAIIYSILIKTRYIPKKRK
ncbi:MAG: glycine-rich domain-containing protein [Nanoarchaeota archaeon]